MNKTNNSEQVNRFHRAKFIFEDLEKFVVMDVFFKVALDDLKFSFSKILNLDFYGKKFKYTFVNHLNKEEDLISSMLLEEQDCIIQFIKNQQNKEMLFKVRFIDIGA